ncbi:MAG: endonuclease/exonuclease/phosphatase family protein [Verrucomicrobiota bacterium]
MRQGKTVFTLIDSLGSPIVNRDWVSRWIVCGLLIVLVEPGHALTVASYNLQNYLSTGRMVDGRFRRNYPKPEAEKQALREGILRVDPDILAVQEMGERSYLKEFQRDLRREGLDYPYVYLGVGVDQVRHTAVLSKVEPASVKSHLDLRFKYFDEYLTPQRGLLEVQFDGVGKVPEFSLYVVHLKSKRTVRNDDPEAASQREKEARSIRDRILKNHGEGEDAAYLLVGDLNDTRNNPAVLRFLEIGGRKTGQLLPLQDDDGLWWTYYWDRAHQYSRVDYMIAGAAIFERWSGRGAVEAGLEGSDHRLLWAEFE